MGSLRSIEMATAAAQGMISREVALMDHFSANMFPPVPLGMIATATAAIDLVAEGRSTETVTVPSSIVMRKPGGNPIRELSAAEAVDLMNLHSFVAVAEQAA